MAYKTKKKYKVGVGSVSEKPNAKQCLSEAIKSLYNGLKNSDTLKSYLDFYVSLKRHGYTYSTNNVMFILVAKERCYDG